MSQTKRAWKLQEFVAHGANVNCLAMGHKTGRVMVTGGEDRKVNLWTAGKPNCIMSLAGHTTPVDSVRFGHNEEMVVAGSMSGALKIWNLEEAKILRTLTGHKSSVKSLDFHPYGDYAASGSQDSTIKLWDIRRKGCIYTYKGHTNPVNTLRFSPDGKWIASGGEDGLVKIWDLTAGKLLTDMRLHTAGVNVIEFHPNELLLASGSSDKTVKFWDLETFQLICTTDTDASPIRCLYFHPDGTCVYSGVKDFLKVYGWEPTQCYDSVPITWGEVADMSLAQNQLIGASFSKTNVSTFVIDLKRIQPHGGVPHQEGGQQLSSSHGRRSFLTERPPTQSSRQASVPKEDENEPTSTSPDQEDRESVADIRDPEDFKEIFQPKHRIDRSPTRKMEPFQPPSDDEPVKQPAPKAKPATTQAKITKRELPQTRQPDPPAPRQQQPPRQPEPARQPDPTPRVPEQDMRAKPSKQTVHVPPTRRQPSPPPGDGGVNPEDFLPPEVANQGQAQNLSEDASLDMIVKGHNTMLSVLSSRSKSLQTVRVMWTSGNTKTAIDSAISMNDKGVIVDVLNVLNAKSGLWNLDISASLLPHIRDLIAHKYEEYVMIACESLKIILKNFGPLIKANLTAPPSYGVDLSREERYRKCNGCYKHLMDIRTVVDKKSSISGKVGHTFRQLQILLGSLD
ncbi:katanin p80 WD40 repeat-containing subunit B1-like isoform X2 [Mercenaria mercenaria]|uniref:katanin p80 WD40 repeat-containing subunit B1-like isoform X2 n=1 Tax=Mercenaria mercenaria TaxID=6596 RepID=UPI00234F7456|nr:katanin p80 WD40 repeat-containing subunit B1-like isoform X2 [Mercenaria mercenaria]